MTEEKEKKEEVVAFGITSREIAETAKARLSSWIIWAKRDFYHR